ncbi:MAG: Pyridoxal phosphate homeostasis protein [Chlamydiales bacterium]|nr:Pyridoxal phosphate homeostasis protein [Chlamydiales bacterium]
MILGKNLQIVRAQIEQAAHLVERDSKQVTLVVVSKRRSIKEIQELYDLGVRDFGENRVFEALEKMESLPKDIRWHFMGKLQRKKVSHVLGRFALIHSVDTLELAQKIDQVGSQKNIYTRVLLEANTSGELSKGGYSPTDWEGCFAEILAMKNLKVEGLMTMAPYTEDEGVIRYCFSELRNLLKRLQQQGGDLNTLSMGMTNDFALAIQEGATLIRVGRALFTNDVR